MDVYEALYTTRAMRRVRPDPIPLDAQARILDAAVRAPSGGNGQGWRFVLVDSDAVKAQLGPLYRDALGKLWATFYKDRVAAAEADPTSPAGAATLSMVRSAQHLADHFEEVPLYLLAFIQHDPSGGSIFPAVWSAMLAARAEGIGSSLTSVMGVFHGAETLAAVGVPADEGWINACCVSLGYPTGRWGVAPRRPAHKVSFRNQWGTPVGFEIDQPLWQP
ncbi:MAG TPA: nitroreductase family protein [Acidimicrobiales bacterium]|jgi:nitroreductase